METLLRPATPADVPALAALGRDSFIAKFGYLYSASDLNAFLSETHDEAVVAAEVADPDRLYRLAERDGRLVGYCKLGLSCGFPEYARGASAIQLKQLYMAADATGGGLGARFMDWVLEVARMRGADEIQLTVWSGNDGAQRFYQRYGFEKVADILFPVGEQMDEEFVYAMRL